MYKKCKDFITGNDANCIQRLSDNAFIPFDPANVDFQQYQKWLSEGNVPTPADEGVA